MGWLSNYLNRSLGTPVAVPPAVYTKPPTVWETIKGKLDEENTGSNGGMDTGIATPKPAEFGMPISTFPATIKPAELPEGANRNAKLEAIATSPFLRGVEDTPIVPPSPPKSKLTPAFIVPTASEPNLSVVEKIRGVKDRVMDYVSEPIAKGKTYRVVINKPGNPQKVLNMKGKEFAVMGVTLTVADAGNYGDDMFLTLKVGRK